jgi:hypothetical protein
MGVLPGLESVPWPPLVPYLPRPCGVVRQEMNSGAGGRAHPMDHVLRLSWAGYSQDALPYHLLVGGGGIVFWLEPGWKLKGAYYEWDVFS